jgi:4-hydroxy 2-oxovalerate aldolase
VKAKILDCTIRDGGYLNNWDFSIDLVKDLYRSVSKSGVDYIEIGFRSTNKYFDPKDVGIWRFTPEELVNNIVGNIAGVPISLMIDFEKADLSDIPLAVDSKVFLYRIAVHKDKLLNAIEFANNVVDMGYEVAIQIMGIVSYTENDFQKIMPSLTSSKLTYVYFADSYGSLLPKDIEKYINILRQTNKLLGFHPHNNMQLAFSNSLTAIDHGIDIVDGTVFGMGRGAGNMPLEALITYCQKSVDKNKYNALPIFDLINKYFLTLMEEHPWGYNLPYLVSGAYEVHPNYAKNLTKKDEYTIEDISSVLQVINHLNLTGFNENIIPQIIQTGFIGEQNTLQENNIESVNIPSKSPKYINRFENRDFLILANGPSLVTYHNSINKFIELIDPIIIGSNYLGDLYVPDYHTFNNRSLFKKYIDKVSPESHLMLCNRFDHNFIRKHTALDYEHIQYGTENESIFNIENGIMSYNISAISILSIALAVAMGARQIFIAGMDGYKDFETFFAKGLSIKEIIDTESHDDLSNRSGTYHEQMRWHNYLEKLLKQINNYLISCDLNDLIIITPTTHKLYYEGIDNFLKPEKKVV